MADEAEGDRLKAGVTKAAIQKRDGWGRSAPPRLRKPQARHDAPFVRTTRAGAVVPPRKRREGNGMARYDLCVGLGQHCESTYQIRRITGQRHAHFFDWLEIDLEFVQKAIETDFRGLLLPGRMALTTDGPGALDLDAGIAFHHEFTARPGADLTVADVEDQLPAVREKMAFLATRWRELAASRARVLYVRQNTKDVESVADVCLLRDTIADRYPGHDFAILWLCRSLPEDVHKLPMGIAYREVGLVPGRWQGDDAAWDAVFGSLSDDELWPPRRRAGCRAGRTTRDRSRGPKTWSMT
jgi:hypothetical protein